ncbi:MerR family transcriptional regulator [Kribbella qitaiheensis]|uniref:MerR family transcriptional regulator n=1 Tax=Kribbella qitaiheensis TaxID=1544730 RepID=A0A7G6X059_9ACTN|nr:MerR family transcriptional regulator [Kribbella qitaiheensis]QNE19624.1 MerR family transcriptional regulator [Kribbella qitaiheensis]
MTDDLLTISTFARRVGLTPSALRFYDDCGLLRPAEVDEQNGYRYYSPEQEPRASLLRDLREIDLPLADVRVVLDEGPARGAAVVQAHLRTVEGKADTARRAATRILATLPAVPYECAVTLGGAELASAIRQVAAAAAPTDEIPALACVLVELGEDEVTLVASDRYRLSVRKLQPVGFRGSPRSLLVNAAELVELGRWVAGAETAAIETGPGGSTVVRIDTGGEATGSVADGSSRAVKVIEDDFPEYQVILDGLAAPVCRVVVDRLRLLDLLTDGIVALDIQPGQLTVSEVDSSADGPGTTSAPIEAVGVGQVRIGFTAAVLAAALSVSVGPDVLLEISAPETPVIVRSADQGTFTTLVMPARLDG